MLVSPAIRPSEQGGQDGSILHGSHGHGLDLAILAGADGGTGCSPEKVSRARHANVVLFRLLRSCFARSIDWVLCAKELRHALPSLMRRKPLDLNPSRTPLNTNLTSLIQTQGGVKENLQVLLGFLGYF